MNNIPFVFGKLAKFDDFTDREDESKLLESNFRAKINTIIISPRRWGKTSLVNRVAENINSEKNNIKICQLDLFNIRTEEDFYIELTNSVLKATSTKMEDFIENAKEFLSRLVPKITLSQDYQNELSFGISWEDIKKRPDEILDLAENIAKSKNMNIVVCIDEFQSVVDFENPLFFQKRLRSHWQRHTNVSYCIYGSKRHMLLDVFSNPSMPFYKFGDMIFLQKISSENWIEFIQKRFKETGKIIERNEAELITILANNHSYYVQQLAQIAWLRTDIKCDNEVVISSHESLINQLSLLFIHSTDNLSNTQLGFLKALIHKESQFTNKDILKMYNLGTSSNVKRLKESLLAKEIIDILGDKIEIQDPIYAYWLEKYYFKL